MKNEKEQKARIKDILKKLEEAKKEYRELEKEYNTLPDSVKRQEDLEEFKNFEEKIDDAVHTLDHVVKKGGHNAFFDAVKTIEGDIADGLSGLRERYLNGKQTINHDKKPVPAQGLAAAGEKDPSVLEKYKSKIIAKEEGRKEKGIKLPRLSSIRKTVNQKIFHKGSSDEERQKIRTQRQELREGNEEAKETAPAGLAGLFKDERALKKEASDYEAQNYEEESSLISDGKKDITTKYSGEGMVKNEGKTAESMDFDSSRQPFKEHFHPPEKVRKVKISKWKEVKNNCVEYLFAYTDTDEFAGKIVLYKPYFKYFDYSMKNFVGDRGKAFLEEMCDIRYKNPRFAGETSLPMIKEWRDSKKQIHSQSIPTRLTINPITGGFRRLIFMYSVNINGERFWPNVKFPGDFFHKLNIHKEDMDVSIEMMERFRDSKMFPPIMYAELPKGKYNLYGREIAYDSKHIDFSPAILFFFMPEGMRIIDLSIISEKEERYIDMNYIRKVSKNCGKSVDTLINKIVMDPFIFLARCHIMKFYLSWWRGSDAHYGNFFLSTKGEIYQVSDLGPMREEFNKKIRLKDDIDHQLVALDGLKYVLRGLGISDEAMKNTYFPMARRAYLSTIRKEGNEKLNALFPDENSLVFNDEEQKIADGEFDRGLKKLRQTTFEFTKNEITKQVKDKKLASRWINYFHGKLHDDYHDRPSRLDNSKYEIIKRLDDNLLSYEELEKVEKEEKRSREVEYKEDEELPKKIAEEKKEEKPSKEDEEEKPIPPTGKKPRFEVSFISDTGRVDINEEAQYKVKIKEQSGVNQNIGLKCWSENPIDELKLEREKITVPAHKAVIVTLTAKHSAEIKTYVFVKGINEEGFEDQSDAVLEVYKGEKPTKEPEPTPPTKLIDTRLVCKDQEAMENTDYAWFVVLYDKDDNKLDEKEIVFSKEGISIGSNTTKNGRAFVSVRIGLSGDKYLINAYFGGDEKYNPSHCKAELKVVGKKQPTKKPTPTPTQTTGKTSTKTTCYDKTTQINVPVDLGAYLCDKNDAPLEGKTINFSVAGKSARSAQTDLNGEASTSVTPPVAGSFKIKADFAGDNDFDASSGTAELTVTEEPVLPGPTPTGPTPTGPTPTGPTPTGPTPTGPTPTPTAPETKLKKYNADIIVKPYKIPQGQKTNISIELKKVYPMDKSGLKYELQKDEIYYLLIRGNNDINADEKIKKGMILCHVRRGLLETIIEPSKDAVIGGRSFIVFSKKKSGEKSALIYPRKNCFEVVEAKKEGIISHEVNAIAAAIQAIGTPHEKKHGEKKIEFAVFPNRIYKSAEDKQKVIMLIELFNVPEELRDKLYIKEMTFDDYKDKSHIMLVETTVEKKGDAMFQAIVSIDVETKIGHPLTELVLGIEDNNEKEIRISKKDAIEIFNPVAIAKEKEVLRGEEMWVELELKGMKIDKNKKYNFIFMPSSKIDIKKYNKDESAEIGIKVLDAEPIGTKGIKLKIFVPEDELLGSYDLEISEVVDEYGEKEGFRNLMSQMNQNSHQ